ncbi:MAG: isoprenylcysteine carboxylmethyltransferase family protein [Theionarchaea archaeon]|nr:isoprenylcysteine carboxylmethyltransferase family protein [Theionarchaea archaeon]MBU7036565.1 isoprenylcysteine carboxylmethyltransferase family protein [Theionarchaea archaeon]
MKEHEPQPSEGIGMKAVLRFVVFLLVMPLTLFIAAGTVHWTMGWIYILLSYTFTATSRIVVFYKNPETLRERGRSLDAEDVRSWDKALLLFAALLGPLVMLLVAGLDFRFSWSPHIPGLIQLLALIPALLGSVIAGWAMIANKFFSAVVRIQKELNQTVVRDGPYRIVRHPGYLGGIIGMLSTPVILGSLWALLPAACVAGLTIVRTSLEDRALKEELDGYREYAQDVRFRLLPGIW